MWYYIVFRILNFLAFKTDDLISNNGFTATALSKLDRVMCYLVDLWLDSTIVECKINGHRFRSNVENKNRITYMFVAVHKLDLTFEVNNTNLDFIASCLSKYETIKCRSCGLNAVRDIS